MMRAEDEAPYNLNPSPSSSHHRPTYSASNPSNGAYSAYPPPTAPYPTQSQWTPPHPLSHSHLQHAPALPPPPSFSQPQTPPRLATPTSQSSLYKPAPLSTSHQATHAALSSATASSPPLPLTLTILFHLVFLFLVSASSTVLLTCLSSGLLATFLLSSLGLHDLSGVAFLVSTTVYSVLLMLFHDFPASTSTLFSVCFLALTYVSQVSFCAYFVLESPSAKALLPPAAHQLILTLLYSVLPLLSAVLASLTLLPLTGISQAAFYYLALYGAWIQLLLMPSPIDGRSRIVIAPSLLYYHCWMFIFTPCLFHSFIHSAAPVSLAFACDVLLLFTLPFLILAGLSWLAPLATSPFTGSLYSTQGEKERAEVAVAFFAVVLMVACVEYRVVIVSFSPLLYYHASSPLFSTLILTVFLYSALTSFLLLLTGLDPSTSSSSPRVRAFHTSVFVASVSLALTLGLLFLIPLLPVVSYAFSSFFFTRSLWSYAAFLVSVLSGLLYFAHQHLMFLDVEVVGGLSVTALSIVLIVLTLIALAVPALPLIPLPSFLAIYSHSTSALLLLYLLSFALVEFLLYSTNASYPSPIYPPAFPVLTTAIALYVIRLLHSSHRINQFTFSLLLSISVGKLALLLVDTPTDFAHALLIAVAVTSPYTMYVKRMHWMLAVGHAVILVVVLFLAKNTVLAHLLRLAGVQEATESTFVAAYLMVSLLALLPLSAPYPDIRRLHVLAIGVAAVFAALQPRLPSWLFSGESDVFEVQHEADQSYNGWLLMAVAGLLLAGFLGVRPITKAAMNVSGALLLCMYLCSEYLPAAFALYLFFGVIFVSAALIASIVASPADTAFTYPPLVLLTITYCIALPLTFISTTLLFAMRGHSVEEMEQSRIVLFTTYAGLSLLLSVVVTYHRIVSPAPPSTSNRPNPFASFSLTPSSDPQAPLITISNLLLFLSYLSSIVLLVHYLHESEVVILYLSPLLLFIQYDSGRAVKGHAGSSAVDLSRYTPVLAVSALLLALSAAASVLDPLLGPLHALTPHPTFVWTLSFALMEALFVVPAVPLVLYSVVSLATSTLKLPLAVLMTCGPVCAVGCFLGELDSVRLLDGMAASVATVLYLRAAMR